MERIIHVAMIANSMSVNGISAVIMSYCRNFNIKQFQVSVLAGTPIDTSYKDECEQIGVKIIELPPRKKEPGKYYRELFRALKRGRYEIAHVHGNSATIAIELMLARLSGIETRIAHSHNTTCENKLIRRILMPLFRHMYTDAFACGQMAGEWMFPKHDFFIMNNGFQTERFQYSQKSRKTVRSELRLDGKFVLGHIGRINYQKNQGFLIRIFEIIAEKNRDAVLLMVGVGPEEAKIKAQAEKSPYRDRIIFYGETSEPEALYSAMDVFVFPSRYEGLPVTMLEAQISGLPCVVSNVITPEAKLSENVLMLSIENEAEEWARAIQVVGKSNRKSFYNTHRSVIEKYEIRLCVKQVEEKYKSIVARR